MNKRDFAKLNQEQMIIAFNDLKNDYRQLFVINADLEEENQRLKQWDKNKDLRNSRQRVANAKLIKENKELKQQNDLIGKVLDEQLYLQFQDNALIEFEKWLEEDFKNEIEHPTPQIYCNCYSCKIKALEKLKKLKEGKK